jgi:hypothetical protein
MALRSNLACIIVILNAVKDLKFKILRYAQNDKLDCHAYGSQ